MATKKIILEKEEGAGEAVDRILGEPDHALVLVVPRGSMLGKSARNFNLIKRESADVGKEISVESVDENILAFARNAGIPISHPLFRERSTSGASGISDIVPVSRDSEEDDGNDEGEEAEVELPRGRKRVVPARRPVMLRKTSVEAAEENQPEEKEEDDRQERDIAGEDAEQEGQSFFKEEDRFFKKRQIPSVDEINDEDDAERISSRRTLRGSRIGWTVGALAVLGVALYVITVVFGSAKINITFKKTPWGYNGNFVAETATSKIDTTNNIIPAQVFSVPKNITKSFPATGQQNVSLKAQGTITIYNAYSSSPQSLVATTRFVTPDNKIFRLVNAVVVPGAAVTNGQIVPSSITAPIVADQAGVDYNVSSTQKLTIPGFEGTPKYAAFYGSITTSTSGGFVGEKAVPTASDIASAKQAITDTLTSELQGSLTGSYTNNFKILDGATNIQITKITVNTSTDSNGNFSVFGEGTLSAIGFDESSSAATSLKNFFLSIAQSTEASSTFSDFSVNYASATPDFANGKLTFGVNAQGTLEPAFSQDDLRASIAGQKISVAKNAISSLPELQEGAISVWPAWLWQIPANAKKIQITVD
jgi:hypothetical protein